VDFHGAGGTHAPETAEDPVGNEIPLLRVTFYYHPDYLGNVEYISDMNGLPYQYFWYSPWGESLKEHIAASGWESPYRFNGKELDEESGLYYYGARYYNPQVSVWLGVDPLAGKFPAISPLAFSANNPLLYIDPDGKDVSISGSNSARSSAFKQLRAELKLLGVELTMNKNGKLGYKTNENYNQKGTPGSVITFLETIDNSDYKLELAASFTNIIDRENKAFHAGDAFIGVQFDNENQTVSGKQFVNPAALGRADEINGTEGKFMLHAATELATAAEAALNGRETIGRNRYEEFHSTWSLPQPYAIDVFQSKEPIRRTHSDNKTYEIFETYFKVKTDKGWVTYWTIPSEPFNEY
jgi:RHS repeat-associated protein